VAAGDRIGHHYDILVAPFAEVMPGLSRIPYVESLVVWT
jgi:hypothetical protein